MLEDWGLVGAQVAAPSVALYVMIFTAVLAPGRWNVCFGGWRNVRSAFREFAKEKKEWADVAKFCDTVPQEKRGHWSRPRRPTAPMLRRDRPVYGEPLGAMALRNAPTNESGVVLAFGMLAEQLGFHILSVQPGFPDLLRRCGRWALRGGRTWRSSLRFESANFHKHGHAPKTGATSLSVGPTTGPIAPRNWK